MEQIGLTKSRHYVKNNTKKVKNISGVKRIEFSHKYRQLNHQRRYPCRLVDRVPDVGT